MPTIPGPRRPKKQFECSWCHQKFGSAFKLGQHVGSCTKKSAKCRHPWLSRKKRYTGKITVGTKRYKTWSVTCKKCGTRLPNKSKEIK